MGAPFDALLLPIMLPIHVERVLLSEALEIRLLLSSYIIGLCANRHLLENHHIFSCTNGIAANAVGLYYLVHLLKIIGLTTGARQFSLTLLFHYNIS